MCAQAMPGTTALIVNHENITYNYYRGRDRAFLLAGALFRPGGAAVILSNRCSYIFKRCVNTSDIHEHGGALLPVSMKAIWSCALMLTSVGEPSSAAC